MSPATPSKLWRLKEALGHRWAVFRRVEGFDRFPRRPWLAAHQRVDVPEGGVGQPESVRPGPGGPSLEAVIPLTLRDYQRFKMLRASIDRFIPQLRRCWVVVRQRELAVLADRIRGPRYSVISETAVLPELRVFRWTSGYTRQMLIKLAIADLIESDFYLTLDADVICTRPVVFDDLVRDGRSPCHVHSEAHLRWYLDTERVLQLPRSGVCHNVTPAVLSRHAVRELQGHLTTLNRQGRGRPGRDSWRAYLLRSPGWTEYALYYSFLEATARFDHYHFKAEQPLYSRHSLWFKEDIATWDPRPAFQANDLSPFLVVQSNTDIEPGSVWAKVAPHLLPPPRR